jgi:UDP-N-acetylglucosamine--N-acetylmuramyl-(pentapeptide) pyrophosphoryl-undecaprenol N-acetylglucosamine transferase
VDRIALSHRESVRYLPRFLHHKTAVTGNPVRLEIANTTRAQARASLGLKDVFTILVLGGSQGSSYLNTLVPQALIGLAGEFGFQVIHVCGGKDTEYLNAVYSRLSCNYKIFTYLEEMHLAYGASDLVISRSGATTIAEICLRGLPAILIPYPGAGRHQDLNAQFLGNRGAAVLLADTVGLQELIQILRRLLISPQECRVMAEAAHRLADGRATDKLLTQALALVKERAS